MLLAYTFRAPILTVLTNLWVVDEAPVPADAVVVLGGGVNTRAFAAADLYNQGLAKKVLIPDILLEPIEKLGHKKSESQISKEVVLEKGVPETAIEFYGDQVASTYDEAVAVKEWSLKNEAETVLIPTQLFRFVLHPVLSSMLSSETMSRRTNWIMEKVMGKSETTVNVIPVDTLKYQRESWWTNEYGLIDFQNEVIKYAFYRVKY